ncbi:MAG: AsmA family protein [Chromatiales bacterium]
MRRVLKVLLALLVIVAGAVAVLLFTFDVNRYKPELVAFVERQSGRSFAIAGDIRFAPSLVPTLVLEGVRLGSAAWGRNGDLAAIERIEARVALRPLLERRIEIKRIALSGATLNLETNAQGEGNWILRPASAAKTGKTTAAAALPNLAIESIILEHSTLRYRSGGMANTQALSVDEFTATASAPDTPVAIRLSGAYLQYPIKVLGNVGSWTTLVANESWPVDLSGAVKDLTCTAKGNIDRPLEGQGISLAVAMEAATLTALGDLTGVTLPPLKPASLTATLATEEQHYVLRNLNAKIGRSDLAGNLTITPSPARPTVQGDLNARLVDLTEVMPPPKGKGGRMFSTEPVFINELLPVDARLALRAAEVRTHKMNLADVAADVTVKEGQLQVSPLRARVAGGELDGVITIVPGPVMPSVNLDLRGKGILPGQLPQFQGKRLTGAPTDFAVDIAGAGRSIAEVMGSGNGHILVRMGPGRIPNNLASADLLLDTVRLLNPLSAGDPHTAIECAVFNFGVQNGLASAREGVAVRTDKLTVLGGGVVNLRTEGIDIGVQPKPRAGTGLNVASLGGDLVRIGGTLSDPKPVANAEGVAGAGFKIGAAVATGGLSLLAEGLFDRATANEDVCAIALRGTPRSASAGITAEGGSTTVPAQKKKSVISTATDKTKEAAKSTGEAVQGVFRKILGR